MELCEISHDSCDVYSICTHGVHNVCTSAKMCARETARKDRYKGLYIYKRGLTHIHYYYMYSVYKVHVHAMLEKRSCDYITCYTR